MPLTSESEYDESYATCAETYSTLRIFSDDTAPDEIAKLLHVEPTEAFRIGDSHAQGKLHRRTNAWFFSTKKLSSSKDTRHHIDIILALLEGKEEAVKEIQARSCKIDITSYWLSTGQGGPWLMPHQMVRLGALGISIWWDVYFVDEDKT
jgi:hypothetical protein